MISEILLWYAEGLVPTILIECVMAWILGIRGVKNTSRIALIQCLTNPLLLSIVNIVLSLGITENQYMVLVVLLETCVVVIEAKLLRMLVPAEDLAMARIRKPILLSLTLNATSYFSYYAWLGLLAAIQLLMPV